LKWYARGGENGITSKRTFEVEVSFSSQNETSGASLFFSFSCGLGGGFDDIWGENHFFKNFFSNGFNIMVVDASSEMELCTPTWLNHDYGDGGLWIYWRWTHIPEGMYARQYLWVGLAINVGDKSFLKKIQNSDGHIP
jgi:hypothetical protein